MTVELSPKAAEIVAHTRSLLGWVLIFLVGFTLQSLAIRAENRAENRAEKRAEHRTKVRG